DHAQPLPNSTSETVTITYAPSTMNDGLPDAWKLAHGLDPSSSNPINGMMGDPAGDGIPNLLKYAFNLDPQVAATNPVVSSVQVNPSDGQNYLVVSSPCRIAVADLTFNVIVSSDMINWATGGSQI